MDDKTRELLMKAADDWASAARLLPGYRDQDLLALKERCRAHVRAIRAALAAAPTEHRVPQPLSDKAQMLAAELRGNVAEKDYETWSAEVLPLLDWMTFANIAAAPTPPDVPATGFGDTPPASEPVGHVYRYGSDSHGREWHGIHWYDPNVDVPTGTKLYLHPAPAQQEDAMDAARYRWLRNCDLDDMAQKYWPGGEVPTGEAFDAAIDAAIRKEPT